MMRILVTGGAGYIGSHTVRQLLTAGHEVTVLDNLQYGHREAVPEKLLTVGNIGNAKLVNEVITRNHIEAVIHFAAFANVGESIAVPAKYYTNNLLYSLQLLDCCLRNDVKKFIFSSTCATYGLPTTRTLTETHTQNPINPYGNTKLAFERALADYTTAYPFSACSLRYFNAAGAAPDGSIGENHTPETHLIPLVFQAATRGQPITIFGTDYPTPDGTCIRDYVHVDDLASAHILALTTNKPNTFQAFNVGIGRGYSVREVIQAVEEVSGLKVPVKEGPRRTGDPPELVADASKIRRELGWSPKYDNLHTILETAWKWHQKAKKQ